MVSSPTPVRIATLVSSAVDIVSSHSQISAASIDISIEEQVSSPLFGEVDRIRQTLIIIIERALIQRPNSPITLACSIIKQSGNLATALFSITQIIHERRSTTRPDSNDVDYPEIPEELSLKIAKRIVSECGGKLLIRSSGQLNHEVFFWVPMEIAA